RVERDRTPSHLLKIKACPFCGGLALLGSNFTFPFVRSNQDNPSRRYVVQVCSLLELVPADSDARNRFPIHRSLAILRNRPGREACPESASIRRASFASFQAAPLCLRLFQRDFHPEFSRSGQGNLPLH